MTYHEKAILGAIAVFAWLAAINQISASLARTTRSRWLWWFRPYRRWWMRRHVTLDRLERVCAPAMPTVAEVDDQLARNPRFLRDMGIATEPMAGIDELIESAINYCPDCPLQGSCSACGAYHGPQVRE